MVRTGEDAPLLRRVQDYDPVALAHIYDCYAGRIYSYIYFHLSDAGLAEELTGTVFVKMLEAIRADKAWTRSFSGWLYRIAHNLVVDHVRRDRQRERYGLDERLAAEGADPAGIVARRLEHERLRRALAQLTQEQAQVIVAKFAEGLSNAEIAQRMGKTEGAIKSLQFRAVASLRRILEAEE
ncbi:MAG TPA: sigma-70 family RNA polymerase sigma factor [Anaerolineae bacterium]|nr:sigma-70 family RNA polymerase sigma factor [Anaerolineae bacterium]HOG45293.1 sigma-70 family RNA polymerase sigma factor [Anaerolineae bacterium]HOQ98290.1 sigma-70 family RNA polymerase sigma factor [Anaerolineae bacterium]HPL30801.1 sigma-70 family RNA polymerase sigma factor [Anaerolineae bacterium]